MAKMQDIQKQLEHAAGGKRASVVALAEARPAPPTREAAAPKPSPRAGKKHIGAHLNPAFTTNLLIAKARTGKKIETLIADALNDLFRSLNLPVVEDE
jgi:antitoxin-like ribbon-helix-helix protein